MVSRNPSRWRQGSIRGDHFVIGHDARKRRTEDQPTVLRLSAEDLPVRRSATTSNSTFWPSFSCCRPARSTALIWTKTSFPPSSGWMKPKPLVLLNHFTVPVVMGWPFKIENKRAARPDGQVVELAS